MELIRVKNDNYALYEEALLQRERLRREAHNYEILYIKEFGDLLLGLFELEVACIRKKKKLSYYQRALNQSKKIRQDQVEALLKQEMREYQEKLDAMLEENQAIKRMKEASKEELEKIKIIYRKLVKELHPDINPKTREIPELQEMWNQINIAYQGNCLEELQEAELLVKQILERLDLGCLDIEIPNLETKIQMVWKEINKILTTDPYQYRSLLKDPLAVARKKEKLAEDKRALTRYKEELDQTIEDMLKRGLQIIWQMK